jgi:hypothetical protein
MSQVETYKQARARLQQLSVEQLIEQLDRVLDELDERDLVEFDFSFTCR